MTRPRVTSDTGPYAIVPEWVAVKLSPRALKLYVLLAVYAHRETKSSWYSRGSLAKALQCSTDTVDRMSRECVEAGALVITERRRESGASSSNYYTIVTVARAANLRPPSRNGAAPEAANLRPLVEPEGFELDGGSPNGEPRATEVAPVWTAYQQHHPAAKLTHDRRQLIQRRLKDYPAATLIAAIEGNHESEWHRGDNPMGKRYHDLGLILRNADHIESFAELHQEPKGGKRYVDLQEALRNAQAAGFSA